MLSPAKPTPNETLCPVEVEYEYEVYQKDHWISQEGPGIYVRHNTIYRKTFVRDKRAKKETEDILITQNHALMMYNPLLPEKSE